MRYVCTFLFVSIIVLSGCKKGDAPSANSDIKTPDNPQSNVASVSAGSPAEINKLEGAARWEALQNLIISKSEFNVFPSDSFLFKDKTTVIVNNGEQVDKKTQYVLNSVDGFFQFSPAGDGKFQSFIIEEENGVVSVIFYKNKAFKKLECYDIENASCGIDQNYFVMFTNH